MSNLDAIKQLPYWSVGAAAAVSQLLDEAESVRVDAGSLVTEQFKAATHLYLLENGCVEHYIACQGESAQQFPVGQVSTPWRAVGWSGLLEPHRYTTEARCAAPTSLIRWPYARLNTLAAQCPDFHIGMLSLIRDSCVALLECSRQRLDRFPPARVSQGTADEPTQGPRTTQPAPDYCAKHLLSTGLFRNLSAEELHELTTHSTLDHYSRGMSVIAEGAQASDLLVLISGSVNQYFDSTPGSSAHHVRSRFFARSLSRPGQVLSWASLLPCRRETMSTVTNENVTLLRVSSAAISQFRRASSSFEIHLNKQLLHNAIHQLRTTRALLIRQRTRNEHAAVEALIHNIRPQLSIKSPLHKVPNLLGTRITQEDAFFYLNRVGRSGNQFERNVAGLCLDLLHETRRDHEFFQGLRSVYELVTTAPVSEDPRTIRNRSAAEFAKVFSTTRYFIHGEQNLPDTAGHIFILNHLISHPCHALPNGFEFSLDTHFICSMILLPKYGDCGVRVVRKSRSAEYGHETYYNRLGHIYVYTNESRPAGDSSCATDWREKFYDDATSHLERGENVVICPEGTSYGSDQSPGPFKSGAFSLAARQQRDVSIVPIVVVNFDKPPGETILTAVIQPPFRIKERVDPSDRGAMQSFLKQLQKDYRHYIHQAKALTQDA